MDVKNFSKKVLRTLKNNYKDTLNRKKNTFTNSVFTVIQGLTNQQTSYNNLIARYNIITYGTPTQTGSDGYQPNGKDPVVYYTSGSTTLNGLTTDGVKIKTSLNQYLAKLNNKYTFTFEGKPYNNLVILPETGENSVTENDTFRAIGTSFEFLSQSFRREYTILSTDVTDSKKYETFKNEMIGNILSNAKLLEDVDKDLQKEFDAYWLGKAKPAFEKQNKAALEFLNYMETNQLQNFINFVEVDKTQVRDMTFTNEPGNTTEDILMANRKTLINSLILPATNTNNQTFNDSQGPIVITKTKFN
jgi:hypothetical protein